jgi:hypothetical protein
VARSYRRDARGRFAGGGYSGQTGGRGARLMAKGERKGGGAKMTAARPGGTIGKPKGLKPGAVKVKAGAGGVVINRTRAEAASAQRKRSRATVEATRGQVIGAARGVTATAGGGEKVRVRRSSVSQATSWAGLTWFARLSRVALRLTKGLLQVLGLPGRRQERR